jgi:hypothetical protein
MTMPIKYVKGKWVENKWQEPFVDKFTEVTKYMPMHNFECSICHNTTTEQFPFCPYCGKRMEKGD